MSVRFMAWSGLLLAATASSALSQELGDRDSGERLAGLKLGPALLGKPVRAARQLDDVGIDARARHAGGHPTSPSSVR